MRHRPDIIAQDLIKHKIDICFLQETHISDFNFAKYLAEKKIQNESLLVFGNIQSYRYVYSFI